MVSVKQSAHGVKAESHIGKWEVLGWAFSRGRSAWAFVCRCDCGRVSVVRLSTLLDGDSTGCMFCHWQKHNGSHGGSNERLYRIWCHMLGRCRNPTDAKYHRYGGRGIEVCKEWDDYAVFRTWALANGYAENLTIDRKENDGSYEPGNCQWLTLSDNSKKSRVDRKRLRGNA